MKLNKKSWLYLTLRWLYQPIKAAQAVIRRIAYIPQRLLLVQKYANAEFVGLHLGCGSFYLDGWINTDLPPNPQMDFPLDITFPLPFVDNYFNVMYASEVIEHIKLEELRVFLGQAFRVLRPGGVLRLTTPDLEKVCSIYLYQNPKVKPTEFGTVWLDGEFSDDIWINAQFRYWGHQFLYSFKQLKKELEEAGFDNIIRVQPMITNSCFEQLNNLEIRYGDNQPSWIFESTFILEASKPTP